MASEKQIPSIIAAGTHLEGEINSTSTIEIEGQVKGNIKSKIIIIREGGIVDGEIIAETISIKGKFQGNVSAQNINIFNKARINGNIEYSSLSVEDGACIEGQFKKLNKDKQKK